MKKQGAKKWAEGGEKLEKRKGKTTYCTEAAKFKRERREIMGLLKKFNGIFGGGGGARAVWKVVIGDYWNIETERRNEGISTSSMFCRLYRHNFISLVWNNRRTHSSFHNSVLGGSSSLRADRAHENMCHIKYWESGEGESAREVFT